MSAGIGQSHEFLGAPNVVWAYKNFVFAFLKDTLNIEIIEEIKDILVKDESVVFAYLYGSFTEKGQYRDVDIAVYAAAGCDPFRLVPDLKIGLHDHTGIPPDMFDVRVINDLVEHGDLFALLYLQHVFEKNALLVDKDFDRRTAFIEQYNLKYRECEGLLDEVLL